MNPEYDIVIAGGGPAGTGLACGLGGRGWRVALVEAAPVQAKQPPGFDDRGLALSLSSYRILDRTGVWSRLDGRAVPIKRIHVSDQGHFGFVRLAAEELHLPAMGYVVVAGDLGKALQDRLAGLENIDVLRPARVTGAGITGGRVSLSLHGPGGPSDISCRLLVAADGTDSPLRGMLGIRTSTRNYRQTAIVANVSMEKNHDYTAFERFTADGLLALLPVADRRCVSVFCMPTAQAEKLMAGTEDRYLQILQQVFGMRLGRLTRAGTRRSYPLRLVLAAEQYRERMVLLGNAAHTIHPNGAQGLNLALRDAAALAENLADADSRREDPGSRRLLERYQLDRMADQQQVIRFTDGLTDLFYNDNCVKTCLRNTAMQMLNLLPFARRHFMYRAMGIWGRQPALVRGEILPG